jgi:hypothetical protein
MTEIYIRTRDKRYLLGNLLGSGMTERQAIKEAKLGKNAARDIRLWKEIKLYPFGDIDKPETTTQPSTVVPQVYDTVSHHSVINVDDSVLINKIKEVVNMVLEPRIKNIEDKLTCNSSVVQLRPKLKRTIDNCVPTSFRLPKELVKRVKDKAKNDPMGATGLNSVVESLLFQYIGSPEDLLE